MSEERWTADDAQCETIRENMRTFNEKNDMDKRLLKIAEHLNRIADSLDGRNERDGNPERDHYTTQQIRDCSIQLLKEVSK